MEHATFAGGCFWCTEAVFQRLKGVVSVVSGYTGGETKCPTYEQVATSTTGHAEAIQITFDPSIISYQTLLEVFWKLHDPTTKNQQGADIGSQYRSAIFYHNPTQKKEAEASKNRIETERLYENPVVTEIVPITQFYKAEENHQDYYNTNRTNQYCALVIDPKIHKLYKDFKPLVKDGV